MGMSIKRMGASTSPSPPPQGPPLFLVMGERDAQPMPVPVLYKNHTTVVIMMTGYFRITSVAVATSVEEDSVPV